VNIKASEEPLRQPTLVDEEAYLAAYNGDHTFEKTDTRNSKYE